MIQNSLPMADVLQVLREAYGPQKALCDECSYFRELTYVSELDAKLCELCKGPDGEGTLGMNLSKLFEMQRVLDERIIKENNITHDRLDNLVLALLDEVGECAKETRCFKDWSKKGPSPKEVILEEYVDGIHFILSLGLYMDYNLHTGELVEHYKENAKYFKYSTLTRQFLVIYGTISDFAQGDGSYKELFTLYLCLGEMLGFTHEEIEVAYFTKNEINHQRQNEGY